MLNSIGIDKKTYMASPNILNKQPQWYLFNNITICTTLLQLQILFQKA